MSVNSHPHKIHKRKQNDWLIYVAVAAGPIMTIPQIYDIWVRGEKQVSIISWSSYLVIGFIWLWYGFKRHDIPIILAQLVWIILDLLIVVGLAR